MDDELFEQIDYDLCIYGDITVESKKHRFMVIKTLAQIPKDVRKKILDETIFVIACKGVLGTTFDLKIMLPETLRFVVLNFGEQKGRSEPEILSTIAHEIAHSLLGHGLLVDSNAEGDADDLIEKWGFKRTYKNYDRFRRLWETASRKHTKEGSRN